MMSVVSVKTVPREEPSVLAEFMFFNEERLSNNIPYRSPGHGMKGMSYDQQHGCKLPVRREICNSHARIAALLSRIFIHTTD